MFNSPFKSAINILLVEDTPSDVIFVEHFLQDTETEEFNIIHASTLSEALPQLTSHDIHAVMLDLLLPDTQGLEGLTSIQAVAPTLPVLILTGRNDEALATQAVEKGAQDYIFKDRLETNSLQRSIRYAIQRKRYENAILHQAHHDSLTSLPNRDLFIDRLSIALARQQRSHQSMALMMLDLNGFKMINDTYGHEFGDNVLREIGKRIPQCLRPYDLAARLGGDEFVILIEDVKQHNDYAAVAQKLIERIKFPMVFKSTQVSVGVSIGIATSTGLEPITPDDLLHQADLAMYKAKARQQSDYEFYDYAPKSGDKLIMLGTHYA